MNEYFALLKSQPQTNAQDWFQGVASLLMNRTTLMIADQPYRLREIEFYYNADAHPDPFVHCDPIQQTSGRWYFHRDKEKYRGGSFKGLDITFGPEGHYGGILLRSISGADGTFVNGSCLCVNHMLEKTGFEQVADLDGEIDKRSVWEPSSPLSLRPAQDMDALGLWVTARVGLSLKRIYKFPKMPNYIMKPYRFINDSKQAKKGLIHLIIALHQEGKDIDEIRALTGSPKKSIERYISDYTKGMALNSFDTWRGKSLKNFDLCQMHAVWHKMYVRA